MSSTVNEVEVVVPVIVPFAVAVPTPLSLKTSAADEGIDTVQLGDGEGDAPVPGLPQAAALIKIAASATQRLMRGNPHQLCTRALPVKVT